MTAVDAILASVYLFYMSFLPAEYLVLREGGLSDSDEWVICLGAAFFFLVILWGVPPSLVTLTLYPPNLKVKIGFLAITLFGQLIIYFTPDPSYRNAWRQVFSHRAAFVYGLIATVVVYVWWGEAHLEICLWVFLLNVVILAALMIHGRNEGDDKPVVGSHHPVTRNSKKLAKRLLKRKRSFILRRCVLIAFLFASVCYVVMRLYFLSEVIEYW